MVSRVKRSRWGLPLALVTAVVVAEAAVFVMWPRKGVIEPAQVSARSYFSQAQIDHAKHYNDPRLLLWLGQLVLEGAVLAWLIRRPPGALVRHRRRPLVAGAVAGGALALALGVVTLPLAAVSHQRAVDVGLSTQSWGGWAGDAVKSGAISLGFAGVGAAMGLGLMRRFPRHWWIPGSGVVVALSVVFIYAGPVVLDPVFNRFTPLPQGQVRGDVLELARKAGVRVKQVYEVDASRRTTAANAYVTGIGTTKRVVLYDTLIKDFTRDELRLVVAHELGHVHYDDVPRGLLWLALVAPAALLAVQRMTERLSGRRDGVPATLPALVLSIGIVSLLLTSVSNQLSRRVEARADSFALQVTRAPEPFIGFEHRIALQNVADPDPSHWETFLFGTHPPTVRRIGAAVAFGRRLEAGGR